MCPRNGSRRDAVAAGYSVGELCNATEPTRQPAQPQAKRIRVELVGNDRATAFGLTITGYAPLCALCRKLIRAGLPPDLSIEAYRGDTLALRAPSLRAAAQLTVEDSRNGRPHFRRYRPPSWEVARPIAQNAPEVPRQPPSRGNVPRESAAAARPPFYGRPRVVP